MEAFAPYGHALTALALFALMTLVLGPVSAGIKAKAGVTSGAAPAADYDSGVYRLYRAHENAVESLGPFAAMTVAAILANAAPFWVNLAASVFLLTRVVHLTVHVTGWGRADMGLRTYVYVAGFLCCLLLGVLTIGAVFT
ncbi:membrane protein [Oceanicola sp. 22II-s10i]|uniref:MAPEG family protein n=1 Tax=Oceanicola sp. 22II-s10i TaxID=1317116 RepID=UPI000B520C16|nr:MAPEG family protein [Oceanicola sp. 22II-s10i]OWU83659.1 membrane protein [Oceanicola sp. 22II-s10i]